MKKIALLAAIALIPLSVYAYMDRSDSYDDYQVFSQQFQRDVADHHHNMMFHHCSRAGRIGQYRHHHTYSHEVFHQEAGTECPGIGNGCAWLDGPVRDGSRTWYPRFKHING